jgi:hypothetical protein
MAVGKVKCQIQKWQDKPAFWFFLKYQVTKAVQRETGALAIGPMLQGLNKPVNLSRGCTVDDIINTVVITAIQAQGL